MYPTLDLPKDDHYITRTNTQDIYEVSSSTIDLDELIQAVQSTGYVIVRSYVNRYSCSIVKFKTT